MSVTIQINSVAAMERLLEGEGDEQASIRKAVLLEYERRHILPAIEARVKAIVEASIREQLATIDYRGLHLKPEFEENVKATARNAGADAIDAAIRSQIKASVAEYVKAIDAKVKNYVDDISLDMVQKALLKKLGA